MSATPLGIGIGGKGEQLGDPLGMVHRDVEADDRAVAPADDRRLWDLQGIHQPHHVGRHQIVAVRLLVAGAAAVAAAVHDDDPVAASATRGPGCPNNWRWRDRHAAGSPARRDRTRRTRSGCR